MSVILFPVVKDDTVYDISSVIEPSYLPLLSPPRHCYCTIRQLRDLDLFLAIDSLTNTRLVTNNENGFTLVSNSKDPRTKTNSFVLVVCLVIPVMR